MSVYKRGAKGVFYMNFTVDNVRVTRSTGKFTKKEAKLVEAVEKKRMMVDGALSPRYAHLNPVKLIRAAEVLELQ